jgi:hypothetical protein
MLRSNPFPNPYPYAHAHASPNFKTPDMIQRPIDMPCPFGDIQNSNADPSRFMQNIQNKLVATVANPQDPPFKLESPWRTCNDTSASRQCLQIPPFPKLS